MVDVAPEVVDKGFVLRSLRHFIDGLELDFARYAAEFHQSNQWEAEGYNSAADWMRFNCHMNSYAVWNALAAGEQGAKLAQSIESMKAGEIGFAHLATLGRTADELGKGFDEGKLLPLAKKHSPGKFHQKVLHYKHSVRRRGLPPRPGAAGRRAPAAHEHGPRRLPASLWRARSGRRGGCAERAGAFGAAVWCPRRPESGAALRRRSGRAGLGRQAGQPPGHGHHRDPEGSGGGRGGGDGVLAAYLIHLGAADGLRLQRDSRPAQPGLHAGRRRALEAGHLGSSGPRIESSRRELQVAAVRTLRLDVRWTSPGALDRGRSDRSRQPGPALSPAPSDGA